MKIFVYFILASILVSCGDFADFDAKSNYEEALGLYRDQEYERALIKLEPVFGQNSDEISSELLAKSLYLRGFIYYLRNNAKEAFSDYLRAMEIADDLGDGKMTSRLNNEIGQIFFEKELFEQSLSHFKLALSQADEATTQDRAYYNFGVGKSLLKLNRFEEAMDYFLVAVDINEQLRNNDALAGDHMELGVLMRKVGNYDQAIEHYEKVIKIAPLTFKSDLYLWLGNNNLGNVYLSKQNFDKAEEYLQKSLLYKNTENQLWVTYNNLGKVYNAKGEYEKAWNCFKKSLAYNSQKVEMNELIVTNNALKKTFLKLNQPDSLLHYTMLINDMALPAVQTNRWLKDEEEKIALLTKFQDYQKEKAERDQYAKTSWLLAFIVAFIFFSGVLAIRLWKIYNYKSPQKAHALIKNSSEMVYLLDMFKREKDEIKKMMDQKFGGS
ncbi:MAG: tetratricopeptide repeat protein [Reichenbachiella sp.]|uniref:tetratricopeptide repeat protein n=1 Tax=Reichenbachiella sp. TaxID=2184521 RepID=UPI0032642CD5